MTKKIRLLSFCCLLLALVGCIHLIDQPYFTVKESGLNWLSIRYYDYRTVPMQRVVMNLDGNGIVSVREGTSIQVSNIFAASNSDPHWHDVNESRIVIPPEDMTRVFQILVDKGLFVERYRGKSSNTNESIFVSANIQNKTCGSQDDVYGANPELAERLKTVMLSFYRPQPRRARTPDIKYIE